MGLYRVCKLPDLMPWLGIATGTGAKLQSSVALASALATLNGSANISAIISLAGYAFLFRSEAGKGGTAGGPGPAKLAHIEPKSSAFIVAKTSMGERRLAKQGAILQQASNQLSREDAPDARAADEAAGQLPEDALLERAFDQLSHENVAGARAVYENVAQGGSARGALGLAETYDPDFLTSHQIQGLKADPALARLWYEKAAKLGSSEAANLKALTKARSSASKVLRC